MTAELFYEVLMGELTARSGDPGSGYALVLDAARRSRDAKLFQRAVEIALQARSGDAALAAARAWKESLPQSRDARRFELQILIALNRIAETRRAAARPNCAATPQVERPFLMAVIARNYARATDKKLAASVVEQALADDLKSPATGGAAWATVGRLRLAAGDAAGRAGSRAQGPGDRSLRRWPGHAGARIDGPRPARRPKRWSSATSPAPRSCPRCASPMRACWWKAAATPMRAQNSPR